MGSIPNIIKQLWLHHYIDDTLEALIITLTLFTTMLMLDVGPPIIRIDEYKNFLFGTILVLASFP